MEEFRQRLQALQAMSRAEQDREQVQREMAELAAAYDARTTARRLRNVQAERLKVLERILRHLEVEEALKALRQQPVARDFRGPKLQRNAEMNYVKLVLTRTHRQIIPAYQVEVRQVGVRAFEAGQVYIEVATFTRRGNVWKVAPLQPPLIYAPENQAAIQAMIASGLLAWMQRALDAQAEAASDS